MSAIPVILLTGYLGAGKTTVLNRLLAQAEVAGREPALIINEFGLMGVDGALVPGRDDRKFEINQGSLFCTCTQVQFLAALKRVAEVIRPGLLLIEATGVSETRSLEGAAALPGLSRAFKLQANVCVVDALNFTRIAPFLKVVTQQVRWADGIVVNKTDLVTPGQLGALGEVLAGLNPGAQRVAVERGAVPAGFVFGLRHVKREGAPLRCAPGEIVAVAVQADAPADRDRFMRAVRGLGRRLLRLKGNVDFGPDGRRFVEVVYDAVSTGEAVKGLEGRTAFTAIGWRVTEEELRAAFAGALEGGASDRAGGPRPCG